MYTKTSEKQVLVSNAELYSLCLSYQNREKKMSRVNYYYQSAFNCQNEKLDILAEMLEIS